VVDAALGGRIQLVTSHDLLDELRTSTRVSTTVVGSADRRFDVATEVVKLVMEVSIVFVPIRHATRARDADDNRVLDAAAAGSVDVIISGDADLLSLREYNGTPICGASDFVARMLQGT
jgi:uncharacterized protein